MQLDQDIAVNAQKSFSTTTQYDLYFVQFICKIIHVFPDVFRTLSTSIIAIVEFCNNANETLKYFVASNCSRTLFIRVVYTIRSFA